MKPLNRMYDVLKQHFFYNFQLGHVRAEVWMHISGASNLQRRFPELYQSLVHAQHDKEIGKFFSKILVIYFTKKKYISKLDYVLMNDLSKHSLAEMNQRNSIEFGTQKYVL